MKISSASKKVLASALSAAMVVAFAPTVAFAAEGDGAGSGSSITADDIANAILGSKTLTESEAIAAGAVASVTSANASGTLNGAKTTYYTDLQAAFTAAGANGGTVKVLAEPKLGTAAHSWGMEVAKGKVVTVDLNGFEIANDTDGVNTNTATAALNLTEGSTGSGNGTITVKNGTVTAADVVNGENKEKQDAITAVKDLSVTLEGITTASKVTGADAVKSGTYAAIAAQGNETITISGTVAAKSIKGNVKAAKGADLTVEATNSKNGEQVVGIDGTLAFDTLSAGKTASVKVSAVNTGSTVAGEMVKCAEGTKAVDGATYYKLEDGKYSKVTEKLDDGSTDVSNYYTFTAAKSATATAVSGAVSGIAEGATLEATAKATGYDADGKFQADGVDKDVDPNTNAMAVGSVSGEIVKGALTASATSVDGTATGVGSDGLTVKGGTVAVSAEGATAEKSVAVSGNLTAATGTFTGKYTAAEKGLTGGKYTVKPGSAAFDADKYVIVDDGTFFSIEQAKNFTVGKTAAYNKNVAADSDNDKAIKLFAENLLQDISAGKSVSGIVLAKDVKEADLVSKSASKDLQLNYVKVAYNAKRATDEQKAAYEALKKFATDNLSLIEDANGTTIIFHELSLGYTDKAGNYVKMADVKDLGTKVDGRDTVANSVQLVAEDHTKGEFISYESSVSKMAYAVKDGKTQDYVESAKIPFATAYMTTDSAALKDAVIKGDNNEPAVEKATQGIDVDKKSKTVKIKKAKKTKKAYSFNIGASAQTEPAIAKASGSSKISVKNNGKITLKKGVKKGTYKAKVTIVAPP